MVEKLESRVTTLATLASCTSQEANVVSRWLLSAGMEPDVAAEKCRMFEGAAGRLIDEGVDGNTAARVFWVPGRVEVAGKHTDYAGGRSLLAATSKGFTVVSADRGDNLCRIFTTFGLSRERSSAQLQISSDLEPEDGHWSLYPATVIRRLARNFDIRLGADIALECDLPESSGMSTSSAVVCYMWLVLSERNDIRSTPKFQQYLKTDEELYAYLGFIENGQDCGAGLLGDRGVGTFGGSEDHTAIMSCRARQLEVYSYCPTKHLGSFPFPVDMVFVIAVSGALAEKTGDAMCDFNNAAFLARDAALAWCDATSERPLDGATFVRDCPNLAEVIRHVSQHMKGALGEEVKKAISISIAKVDNGSQYGPSRDGPRYPAGALQRRFEQFFDESEILVPRLAETLGAEDFDEVGRLSDESHRQTVECLRNSIPETAWLPGEARRLGALGASAFGAGFGGSCWALVERKKAATFSDAWLKAYCEAFPRWAKSCVFFTMLPGPGALVM